MLWYNVGTQTDLKHGREGLEVPEELLHGHLAGVEHVEAAQLTAISEVYKSKCVYVEKDT